MTERSKGTAHGVGFGVATTFLSYNLIEFIESPNWENGMNVVVYTIAAGWEGTRAIKHLLRAAHEYAV